MRLSRHALAVAFALGGIATCRRRQREEIRIGQTLPYSGPVSGFGIIGKAARSLFRQDQRRRRHQWPQDQVHLPRRRLLAAEDGRADPQAGRAGRSADDVRLARNRHQQRRASLPQRQESSAAVRAERRDQMGRPEEFPMDHAGHGGLRIRRRGLRQIHSADQAGRQNRHPLAERRFRPRLCRRLQARARAARPPP